jgi:hypothetical protein
MDDDNAYLAEVFRALSAQGYQPSGPAAVAEPMLDRPESIPAPAPPVQSMEPRYIQQWEPPRGEGVPGPTYPTPHVGSALPEYADRAQGLNVFPEQPLPAPPPMGQPAAPQQPPGPPPMITAPPLVYNLPPIRTEPPQQRQPSDEELLVAMAKEDALGPLPGAKAKR